MKVKVCGLRNEDNISRLASLSIDYMGFIFYPKSPRFVDYEKLSKYLHKAQESMEGIKRVGVFVNAEVDQVLNQVHDYRLDYVQLHGEESPEYCREILSYWEISTMRQAKLIKVFPISKEFDFDQTTPFASVCEFFLFDTQTESKGGSGQKFDWALLDQYQGQTPFFLSGGIDENSVADIKSLDMPNLHGVDINSRFETEPGIKDVKKVEKFINELKS